VKGYQNHLRILNVLKMDDKTRHGTGFIGKMEFCDAEMRFPNIHIVEGTIGRL